MFYARFIPVFFFIILFTPQAQGQYTDVSWDLGLHTDHTSGYLGSGISLVDFNGDGIDDLTFCHHLGVIYAYVGDGVGGFSMVNLGLDNGNEDAKSVSWVDIDNDGDQDCFITNRLAPNRLFLNLGDGTFEDISA